MELDEKALKDAAAIIADEAGKGAAGNQFGRVAHTKFASAKESKDDKKPAAVAGRRKTTD
jgi:hypothetical protein